MLKAQTLRRSIRRSVVEALEDRKLLSGWWQLALASDAGVAGNARYNVSGELSVDGGNGSWHQGDSTAAAVAGGVSGSMDVTHRSSGNQHTYDFNNQTVGVGSQDGKPYWSREWNAIRLYLAYNSQMNNPGEYLNYYDHTWTGSVKALKLNHIKVINAADTSTFVLATAKSSVTATPPPTVTVQRDSTTGKAEIFLQGDSNADDAASPSDKDLEGEEHILYRVVDGTGTVFATATLKEIRQSGGNGRRIDLTDSLGTEVFVEAGVDNDNSGTLGDGTDGEVIRKVRVSIIGKPHITVSSEDQPAKESDLTSREITFYRSGSTVDELTVDYSLADSSATLDADFAVSGDDITNSSSRSRQVKFAAGSAAAVVTITPLSDEIIDPDERVWAEISAANVYTLGASSRTYVAIKDLPVVTITASDKEASEEGAGTADENLGQFTISRGGSAGLGDFEEALTVYYKIDQSENDYATTGNDYTRPPNYDAQADMYFVTLAAGEESAVIDINPRDDIEYEGDEYVEAMLVVDVNASSHSGVNYQFINANGSVSAFPSSPASRPALVTIIDNEPPGALLAVDANGDGIIHTDGRDSTTGDDPYVFWLNDDSDGYAFSLLAGGGAATDIPGSAADSSTIKIGSRIGTDSDVGLASARIKDVFRRDLEDFTQVGLTYSEALAMSANKIVFDIQGADNPEMSLRMWRSITTTGYGYDNSTQSYKFSSTAHVTNEGLAADTIQLVTDNYSASRPNSFQTLFSNSPIEFPLNEFAAKFSIEGTAPNHFTQLMFEGVAAGRGEVVVRFMNSDTLLSESSFHLDLRPSSDLFEHHTVAEGTEVTATGNWNKTFDPKVTPVKAAPRLVSGGTAGSFARDKDYILFVHGWNTYLPDRLFSAGTAFKRLFWQGYRGSFGMFSWPTEGTDTPLADPGNFNRSEEIAWNSAAGLNALLNAKQSVRTAGGKLTVLAHSMGGIVTSEALKLAGNVKLVDTTILTQAAVATEFYSGVVTGPDALHYSAFGGEVGGANPRFKSIDQATTKLINYNNTQDYALNIGWQANNKQKPGGPLHVESVGAEGYSGFQYGINAGAAPAVIVRYNSILPTGLPLFLAIDRYEMFAHGLYAPCEAIGELDVAIGPFTGSFDLKTIGLGASRPDHSGQFNHTNIAVGAYWARLMQDGGH